MWSSISSGRVITFRGRLALFFTAYSTASDCPQKEVAMTSEGWPSATERFTSRPSANT